MKKCEYCNKQMLRQNFKKHTQRCLYVNSLGIKKDIVMNLIQKYKQGKSVEEIEKEEEFKDIKLEEFNMFLKDAYRKTHFLYSKYFLSEPKDPLEKISEMHLSESTK